MLRLHHRTSRLGDQVICYLGKTAGKTCYNSRRPQDGGYLPPAASGLLLRLMFAAFVCFVGVPRAASRVRLPRIPRLASAPATIRRHLVMVPPHGDDLKVVL